MQTGSNKSPRFGLGASWVGRTFLECTSFEDLSPDVLGRTSQESWPAGAPIGIAVQAVVSRQNAGSTRMRVFRAAAGIALMVGPAVAESQSGPRYGDTDKTKSPQESEADRAAERAYKR